MDPDVAQLKGNKDQRDEMFRVASAHPMIYEASSVSQQCLASPCIYSLSASSIRTQRNIR